MIPALNPIKEKASNIKPCDHMTEHPAQLDFAEVWGNSAVLTPPLIDHPFEDVDLCCFCPPSELWPPLSRPVFLFQKPIIPVLGFIEMALGWVEAVKFDTRELPATNLVRTGDIKMPWTDKVLISSRVQLGRP